jgi:hypothetical protein
VLSRCILGETIAAVSIHWNILFLIVAHLMKGVFNVIEIRGNISMTIFRDLTYLEFLIKPSLFSEYVIGNLNKID